MAIKPLQVNLDKVLSALALAKENTEEESPISRFMLAIGLPDVVADEVIETGKGNVHRFEAKLTPEFLQFAVKGISKVLGHYRLEYSDLKGSKYYTWVIKGKGFIELEVDKLKNVIFWLRTL
jgi:hypothetical protein